MKWLSPEERAKIQAWLDSGATPTSGKYGKFYRLFVSIAMGSGLRAAEIVGDERYGHRGITHGQMNLVAVKIEQVKRLKRKAFRSDAPLDPRSIRIYSEIFPDKGDPDEEVFPGKPGTEDCYKFCVRLGKKLGITHLTPHRFRHTLGKDMADSGATTGEIQKILGHSSAAMSVVYTEATDEKAMAAAKRVRE